MYPDCIWASEGLHVILASQQRKPILAIAQSYRRRISFINEWLMSIIVCLKAIS